MRKENQFDRYNAQQIAEIAREVAPSDMPLGKNFGEQLHQAICASCQKQRE